MELAKMAINEKLEAEGRFPPLEEYIGRMFVAYIWFWIARLTLSRGNFK